MRTLFLGIDSGTQSTKVLVVESRQGKVLGEAAQAYDLIADLPPGAKEQHPHTWRDATANAIRAALKQAKASAAEVKAIGVSGQQHGFVPLDKAGEVIRPAKLWCDTSTAAECEQIMDKLGGPQADHSPPGQCRSARLHRVKNSLAQEARAEELRAPGHRPAAARLSEFLADRQQGHGIRRRQRHRPARCPQTQMVASRPATPLIRARPRHVAAT